MPLLRGGEREIARVSPERSWKRRRETRKAGEGFFIFLMLIFFSSFFLLLLSPGRATKHDSYHDSQLKRVTELMPGPPLSHVPPGMPHRGKILIKKKERFLKNGRFFFFFSFLLSFHVFFPSESSTLLLLLRN